MATRGPSNVLIKQGRDKFLRAVLAGAKFTQYNELEPDGTTVRPQWRGCWFIDLPEYRLTQRGYITGPYKWRHLAVDAALKFMELE